MFKILLGILFVATVAFAGGVFDSINVDNISINGNTISATNSAGNIVLSPFTGQQVLMGATTGSIPWAQFEIDTTGEGAQFGAGTFSTLGHVSTLNLYKSHSNSIGTQTVITNNELLGAINFSGSDGADWITAAYIAAEVDGTPGTTDMPGRLVFQVTPNGSDTPVEAMRISQDKTVSMAGSLALSTFTAGSIPFMGSSGVFTQDNANFYFSNSEDKIYIGAAGVAYGSTSNGIEMNESATGPAITGNAWNAVAAAGGSSATFQRSRSSTIGTHTVVQDGDSLGLLIFTGSDGTNFENGASMNVEVDGTPGNNDLPTRIVFKVTPDGSATLAEAVRISQDKKLTLAGTLDTALTTAGPAIVDSSGVMTSEATLAIARGGTGQATANLGLNALLPSQTSNANKFLKTDGTNTSWTSATANLAVVNKTSGYSVTTSDDVVTGDTSSAGFTLTLPTAVGNSGKQFMFIKTNTDTSKALNIDGNGTETIGGFTSIDLLSVNARMVIVSDNTNWQILAFSDPWRIDANLSGATIALSTGTEASYIEITNGSLSLTNNSATGGLAVQVPCSTTNTPSGTTCSGGSESVGVAFSLPAGRKDVQACVSFGHTISNTTTAGNGALTTFQIVETPTNAQTISQEGKSRVQTRSRQPATTAAFISTAPYRLCGQFTFAASGTKVLRLMYEQTISGGISASELEAAGDNPGQRDIHWEVYPL